MKVNLRKLKIKIKSLAAEQVIIKQEELRARKTDRWNWKRDRMFHCSEGSLKYHRIHHVRPELRSTYIAYGLLRGLPLEDIESPRSEKSLLRKPYREPDWKRIESIMEKYKV